jgi:hypothetical protein
MIKLQSRVSKHKEFIYSYLRNIDQECNLIRFQMTDENAHERELLKRMKHLTLLQLKYRRRSRLLNL